VRVMFLLVDGGGKHEEIMAQDFVIGEVPQSTKVPVRRFNQSTSNTNSGIE